MNLYYKLNLPKIPTDNVDRWVDHVNHILPTKKWYDIIHVDPAVFLSPSVNAAFIGAGLTPRTVFLFASKTLVRSDEVVKAYTHFDVMWNGKQWVPHISCVNWELTHTTSTFLWYDMKETTHRLDVSSKPDDRNKLGAAYYQNINDDRTVIESVTSTGAMLVRTDVPHNVKYIQHDTTRPRINASLRFEEEGQSWDSIVDKLKDFIV